MNDTVVEYGERIAVHPGYYVKELVEESGLTQEDYARRLGTTPKNLSILIRGEQSLSIDMATKLSRMLGTTVVYWLRLQQAYDARIAEFRMAEESKREKEVLRERNYRYFSENYNLPAFPKLPEERIQSLRLFLKVGSLVVLEEKRLSVSFRKNAETMERRNIINANAQVQIAINRTIETDAPGFNREKLTKALLQLPALDWKQSGIWEETENLLKEAGVVLMILPGLRVAGISGATKRVKGRVMLMVNDVKPSLENVRFTIFHEIGHILNGDFGITCNGDAEDDADRFARELERKCKR